MKLFRSRHVIYTASTFINAGIPFLLLPILSRTLSPSDYGALSLSMTIYAFLTPVMALGLPSYTYISYIEEKSTNQSKIFFLIKINIFWAILATAITSVIYSLFLTSNNLNIHEFSQITPFLLIFISLGCALNATFTTTLQLFIAKKMAYKYSIFQIFYTAAAFSITIIFLYSTRKFESRVFGTVAADCIFFFISVLVILKEKTTETSSIDRAHLRKDYFAFGFGILPHLISSTLISTADKIIIASQLSLSDLGSYAIAAQYASIAIVFNQGILKDWGRQYMERPYNAETKSSAIKYSLMISIFAILLWLSHPIFYEIFVGKNYVRTPGIIAFLLLAQTLHGLYMITSVHIVYAKKTAILSGITVLSVIFGIFASFTLLKNYGMAGVAIGSIVGMLIKMLISSIYVMKLRTAEALHNQTSIL